MDNQQGADGAEVVSLEEVKKSASESVPDTEKPHVYVMNGVIELHPEQIINATIDWLYKTYPQGITWEKKKDE